MAFVRPARGALGVLGLSLGLAMLRCGSDDAATPTDQPSDGGGGPAADASLAADASPVSDASPSDGSLTTAPFGLDVRPANPTCKAPPRPSSTVGVSFNETNFANIVLSEAPMMMAQIPGDPSRWFVAARNGRLLSFPTSGIGPFNTVADLGVVSGFPVQAAGEGGFLGFAFPPNFAESGRVYVSWTSTGGPAPTNMRRRIGYLKSTNNGATFTSYTNLVAFDKATDSHNGGGIAVGKDGYLYFSFGDGAVLTNAQTTNTFFAKVLRVDVNVPDGQPYKIPADNPFATTPSFEPATYAFGFRNPFRFSVDRDTGDIWLADVGQVTWEEINRVKAGGNYGWPCREGNHDYSNAPVYCPVANAHDLVDPIAEVEHVAGVSANRSITGGVVYRGKAIPSFVGTYLHGDFQTGQLFGLAANPITGAMEQAVLNPSGPTGGWVHFAEDADGEVFPVSLYGKIFKMNPVGTDTGQPFPAKLSATGCVDAVDPTRSAVGLVPFGVNVAGWNDGATAERAIAIPDGTSMSTDASGHLVIPPGSVLSQTFSLGGKRIETRLLMRHDDGAWAGYSYEWLDDGSDAVLLPSSKRKQIGNQSWSFPGRADCLSCHTDAAGRALGLELGQLDGDFTYAATNRTANQRKTLEHIGILAPAGDAGIFPALPSLNGPGSTESKARAYLHVNCSNCHRPGGSGGGTDQDLRFSSSLADTKTCNVPGARGDFGVAGAKRLVPTAPSKSLLSLRPHALGAGRMPPLGSSVVDTNGLAVLDAWATELTACP